MKKAFTLVELIVVITILAVLATVAFISFQWYTQSAKNGVVLSDLKTLKKAFELHLIEWKTLPTPDGPTHRVTQVGWELFTQWYIGKNVTAEIKKVPQTPRMPVSWEYYSYSKTAYGNNYQIMWTLNEANTGIIPNSFAQWENTKVIDGNYNGLVAYTFSGGVQYLVALPSLMTSTWSDMIYGDTNEFLYEDNSQNTIAYTPKTIWRGTDLPDSIQEKNAMMDNIIAAYEDSSVSTSNRFKDIAQWPESVAYNKMWQIILRDYVQSDTKLDFSKVTRQCDVAWWDVRQDLQWSTWGDSYRVSCYAGFDPVWEYGCEWNNSGFTLSADSFKQSDEPIFKVENIWGEKLFYQAWKRDMFTSWFIPVDTNKTYKLTWDFKNLWSQSATLLFWLKSYDENKEEINARKVWRAWNDVTVASFDDNKITWVETPTGWSAPSAAYHQKVIWIYYDWDTTKLPDYVLKWKDFFYSYEIKEGSYSEIIWNDIMLNRTIPEEIAANIIPWVTKVKNHRSWSTYLYFYQTSGSATTTVWNDWETRSWEVTSEAFTFATQGNFRTGTKYVTIHILANHNWKDSDYILWFDNIKFEELP